jgi:very-short-patch-repair endonuclease
LKKHSSIMPPSPRRRWRASAELQDRARELRRTMTPAERTLWQALRNKQLDGAHFRKQHAVGKVITDFVCVRARLVVEVDGDSHASQAEYDAQRTAWLQAYKGYRVVRFTNREVMNNLAGVVEVIRRELKGEA